MKTLKLLAICFVICCSSSVFAQCLVGIAPSISGEVGFCGSGVPANEALIGDTIVYSVLIETSGAACPISNAVATLTLPDGTVIPVPVSSDLPPGSSESFPCIASYVVMAGDLGQLAVDISPGGTDPTQPNEIRALISASGTADTGPGGNTDEAQGAAVRTTTISEAPCVDITKDVLCEYTKIWPDDPDTVTYDFVVSNCTPDVGGVPGEAVVITSLVDDILGDLLAQFIAANGGSPEIPFGGSVPFSVDYTPQAGDVVPGSDPERIDNIVTVNGVGAISQLEAGPADATASIELVHPSFRVDVTCEQGDTRGDDGALEQRFFVQYTNTGDVDLIITDDIGNVLPLGDIPPAPIEIWIPMIIDAGGTNICGQGVGAFATLTVSATGLIDQNVPAECVLDQVIPPDTDSVDSATCGLDIPCPEPTFTVVKTCVTDNPDNPNNCVLGGEMVEYEITITNTTPVDVDCVTCLDFIVTDLEVGLNGVPLGISVCNGESVDVSSILGPLFAQAPECELGLVGEFEMAPNTALVEAICVDNGESLGDPVESNPAVCCYYCECTPDFEVAKACLTSPLGGDCSLMPGDMAEYEIVISNTGTCNDLLFEVSDPGAVPDTATVGPLAIGESATLTVQVLVPDGDCPGECLPLLNTTNVTMIAPDGTQVTKTATAVCEYSCCTPDFEVEKTCLTSPLGSDCSLAPGDMAEYEIVISNTGTCDDLLFEISDPGAEPETATAGPLAVGESASITVQVLVPDTDCPGQCLPLLNTATVTMIAPDGTQVTKTAEAICEYTCGGEEGCTPGFWKNHPDCWCDSYTPDMLAADVFTALQDPNYAGYSDSKCDFDTDTLMDALNYKGGRGLEGSVRNLLRHATSALLNGCNSNVGFPISDALVIEVVNMALASEDVDIIQELHSVLAEWNEYGCPIDAHCNPHPEEPDGVVIVD